MKDDIRLFIQGKEVEFSNAPTIVFNYKQTEVVNPTVVKNGHSRTIEIPATEGNNDLFGHIWRLDRMQYESTGGVGFNPLKKADFELFANGELVEKGYCKLTAIKREDRAITYSLTLYSGLGSFFYNLAYDDASEDDRKKTLADLVYRIPDWSDDPTWHDPHWGEPEPDLSFTINKETVLEAWESLIGPIADDPNHSPAEDKDPKWDVINFAPAYNGIPADFDADKFLINMSGLTMGTNDWHLAAYVGDNGTVIGPNRQQALYISAARGYSMGEYSQPLTEWETKDLRSYLQRPCINVRRILLACCLPENNGGYDVRLGDHFFDYDNRNPYFSNAWMTLPMLREINTEGGESVTVSGATLEKVDDIHWNVVYNSGSLSEVNGLRMTLNPRFTTTATVDTTKSLSPYHIWETTDTVWSSSYVKRLVRGGAYIMQVRGKNANGDIIAQSKAYAFGNSRYGADNKTPIWAPFWKEGDGPEPEYEMVGGIWKYINNMWVFCDSNGNKKSVTFSVPNGIALASVEIKAMYVDSYEVDYGGLFGPHDGSPLGRSPYFNLYHKAQDIGAYGGDKTFNYAMSEGRKTGEVTPIIENFNAIATDYEKMFSGTYIPKEKLLATPFSPLDFLLSYCKMFGLYFYLNPDEESYDPVRCPNGVVHIFDRNEYYNQEVIDLEELIDRSKEMTITPTIAQSKFLVFNQEAVESDAGAAYESTYGHTYGRQLVNTSWNFDSSSVELYDGNVFKSCPMVTEKDPYFRTLDNNGYQPYITINNGLFRQLLFDRRNNQVYPRNIDANIFSTSPLNTLGLLNYDQFPKMQLHSEDNEPSDGAYVLCFFQDGFNSTGMECVEGGHYFLTDDVEEMVYYNDGEPCWMMSLSDNRCDVFNANTPVTRICWHIHAIPRFTRDWVAFGNLEGPIVHSWNFGHPKTLFVPKINDTEGSTIYDLFWKKYIRDMYDVDNRKLTCYVLFPERPSNEAMRRFYWFDNALWRLNEVKDWNILGLEPTKCEFIKVLDAQAYTLVKPTERGIFEAWVTPERIPATGGVVTVHVKMQDCSGWGTLDGEVYAYDESGHGVTTAALGGAQGCEASASFTAPANTRTDSTLRWVIDLFGDDDQRLTTLKVIQEKKDSHPATYANVYWATGNSTHATYEFIADGGFSDGGLVADGEWYGTTNVSWAKVIPMSETRYTIRVDENSNSIERDFYAYIKSSDGTTLASRKYHQRRGRGY